MLAAAALAAIIDVLGAANGASLDSEAIPVGFLDGMMGT
jgi:hypothetical protein